MRALLVTLTFLFCQSAFADDISDQIQQLGSIRFREREAASSSLFKIGLPLPQIIDACKHSDPEIARRARLVIERLENAKREREDAILESYEPYPMIDALWFDVRKGEYTWNEKQPLHWCYDKLRPYLDRVGYYTEDPMWGCYRRATKNLFRDWLRAGVPPGILRGVWKAMHKRDYVFYRTIGGCFVPSGLPYGSPAFGTWPKTPGRGFSP